uniref:Uncharacterized protein n=1 Tax=Glossina brevipalpis TaxID=37001 RepID=A0A1A9WVU9_9MUSC
MSNSFKNSGQSVKKNRKSHEKTNTISAKKLVQARLPFKVLADKPSPAFTSLAVAEGENNIVIADIRKRKLSFGSDVEEDGGAANHNLSKGHLSVSLESKRKKSSAIKDEEALSIEDSSEDNSSYKASNENIIIQTPKVHTNKKRIGITTPQSINKAQIGKGNSSPKLQIKFPLSSGKKSKKRKSRIRSEDGNKLETRILTDSNDESGLVFNLNPLKKPKIDNKEEDKFVKTESQLKGEEVIELDCEHEDLDKDKIDSVNVETDCERGDVDINQSLTGESTKSAAVLEDPNVKKHKDLTPKQKKLIERRRKIREEKERKLQDEKKRKQEQKDEKEQKKRKEREEKEEQKRKERDERERKRLVEIDAKNEEKRKRNKAKEEELRKREEERKRKEQEKEEAELKKKKAAEAFTKFFLPKTSIDNAATTSICSANDNVKILAFQPFQIKGDMKMAPIVRNILSAESRQTLDALQTRKEYLPEIRLYLALMRSEDELDRVGEAIIQEGLIHGRERTRAKFYQFHDNRRPPYYGTWRKKSTVVTPRKPFVQDKTFFDYDIDSDDEWEEEEPGESLDGSEDDKDKESEDDDYEVDNKWFVPHGHLSEEEMQNEDELVTNDDNTREAQKIKLQMLQQEFSQQMTRKMEKIKPRLIGCVWVDENGNQPENCAKIIWDSLQMRAMLYNESLTFEDQKSEIERSEPLSPMAAATVEKLKPISLSEEMIKKLACLIHGNKHSKNFLINEYIAYVEKTEEAIKNGGVRKPVKSTIRDKIDEIAVWKAVETIESNQEDASLIDSNSNKKHKKRKIKKKLCWVVSQAVLDKMDLQHLDLKNSWNYTLIPKLKNTHEASTNIDKLNESKLLQVYNNEEDQVKEKHDKHQAAEEKIKGQLPEQNNSINMKQQQGTGKKRVPLLISVQRGQKIPSTIKNNLISQFLQKAANSKSSNKVNNTKQTSDSLDENDMVVMD